MQYRKNVKNGDELSALGMGCMRFPRTVTGIDQKKTNKLIDAALGQGINFFDVAYIYPGCEVALGEALSGRREQVKLSTKMPVSHCKKPEDLDIFFDAQLQNLQTDYIDYYLMHMLSSTAVWQRLLDLGIEDWIERKKQSGQIKNIGFSFHGSREEFFKLIAAYPWEFVLVQYNYLDENIQASREGVEYCGKNGIPVFIMEPLRGGYLGAKLPKKAKAMIEKSGHTASQLALGWLWNQPSVTMVLSGMTETWQIEENAATTDKYPPHSMSEDETELVGKIKAEINKKMVVPCTGCGYCMPCPFGVQIPACFASRNSFQIKKVMGWQQYFLSTAQLSDNPQGAKQCKACGKCEKHCPQMIKIPVELKKVRRKMEPFWFGTAKWVVRKVLRPKQKKKQKEKRRTEDESGE